MVIRRELTDEFRRGDIEGRVVHALPWLSAGPDSFGRYPHDGDLAGLHVLSSDLCGLDGWSLLDVDSDRQLWKKARLVTHSEPVFRAKSTVVTGAMTKNGMLCR